VIRALTAVTLALGLAMTGCGSDDSGSTATEPTTVSIPQITSPIPATTAAAPTATTTAPTGTTGNGNGGSGPPSGADPNQPDSATNDVPPPSGSPQDAFEKQCEQNPRACR
jgi:hypothetical protein